MIGLIEGRAAGLAQARLLSPEAGGDGANIGDFAGAQAIDIGRAGPALLRRTLGAGGGRREQGEKESEDGGSLGVAGFGPQADEILPSSLVCPCFRHDSVARGPIWAV
jgi:hypothetical protein